MECRYGKNCFRRNPEHFKEYSHSHLNALLASQKGENIALPDGFKSSMDSTVILEQLKVLSSLKSPKDISTKEIKSDKSEDGIVKKRSLSPKELKNNASAGTPNDKSHERRAGTSSETETKKRKTDNFQNGSFLKKWEDSLPYNLFLTSVTASPRTSTEKLTVKFLDLLDESLGTLESSLQINFMVELEWLLYHYHRTGNRFKPLLILYGVEDDALKDKTLLKDNVKAYHIKPPHPFGHHHTKMSIFRYTDGGVRVVVHTANLIMSDWDNRTQGVWIGPKCMPLPDGANSTDGESCTNFRSDLIRYLCAYKGPYLQEWVSYLRKIDFSPVRVCFVSSVPGSHKGPDLKNWGHMKAGQLLRTNCSRVCRNEGGGEKDSNPWPLVIQCSSVGSLGINPSTWLCGEFRSSLSETLRATQGYATNLRQSSVKVVYPSLKNVSDSHDGLLGGACLPYSRMTHKKQLWFSDYLHHWRSEQRYRSRAVPHIKTYLRWSPGISGGTKGGRLAWFILTSANLSKAAWGSLNKDGNSLNIMSYEAGVLFLPRFFTSEQGVAEEDQVFPLSEGNGNTLPPFPVPYDLPLAPYGPEDKVWQMEYLS